ncbi:MAG TPA: PxKF domain-containing protein [Pyrinomonadaceae bacterium]|nr:PxKF domain-containing protein [Pyrinomonadaceae bacterium]
MKLVKSPRRRIVRRSPNLRQFRWLPILLAITGAMLVGVVAASACTFILSFGGTGSGAGTLTSPRGVAVDLSGNVYVTDPSGDTAGQIFKYDANGVFVARLGQNNGTAQGFINAYGITTDAAGNVYATDGAVESTTNVVKKFNSSGVFQFAFGSTGGGGGQFSAAAGIAVDSSGIIYVADLGAGVVRKFDSAGASIGTIGTSGSGDGQLSAPSGLAIDSANNLYVADSGNNRIQKFNSAGTFVTKWGTMGTGNGEFSGPRGVRVDSAGTVYVADTNNHRVQLFTSSGTFIEVCGSNGSGDGQFQFPEDVASNAAGTFFYVTDRDNARAQKFSTETAVDPTADAGDDQTVECEGATTAVNLDGSGSTAGSGTIDSYSWAEGATPLGTGAMLTVNLPVGVHTIRLTVTDTGGGSDTDDVVITVQDTLAPDITCPADIVVNLPMNSNATSMAVNYPAVTATDSCSSSVTVNSSPASGSVFQLGTTTVSATADDGASHISNCSFTVTVQYNFAGFFQPVDNLPTLNVVNAGRAIPVKFSLSGDKGLGIFAPGSPSSGTIACNSSDPATILEETVTAGGSSLSYNPITDVYNYVWKTEASWAGTCRQLVVQLNDGSIHVANFKFK